MSTLSEEKMSAIFDWVVEFIDANPPNGDEFDASELLTQAFKKFPDIEEEELSNLVVSLLQQLFGYEEGDDFGFGEGEGFPFGMGGWGEGEADFNFKF